MPLRGAISFQIWGHSLFRSGLRLGKSAAPVRPARPCGERSARRFMPPIPPPRMVPMVRPFQNGARL